jgi:hypothetical protein
MTAYEKVKSFGVACLGVFLLAAGFACVTASDSFSRTCLRVNGSLAALNTTFGTINQVSPEVVRTLQASQVQLKTLGPAITRFSKNTQQITNEIDATLDNVNRPCGAADASDEGVSSRPFKPCGTLADVNKALSTIRGTFGQIEVAANHEDKNLTTLDTQEAQLYADFHLTTTNLNTLVSSPDVARFLKSSADSSDQLAIISKHGAGIAADIHKEADALTAPKPWYTKLGAYGTTAVNVACLVTHSCPF